MIIDTYMINLKSTKTNLSLKLIVGVGELIDLRPNVRNLLSAVDLN